MVSIREAKGEDREFVATCLFAMAMEVAEKYGGLVLPDAKTREWMDRCFDEREVALIAEDDGQPIGTMCASTVLARFGTRFTKMAVGNGIFVMHAYRKRFVSDALFATMKRILAERGFEILLDEHNVRNRGFAALSDRHGAVPISTIVMSRLGSEEC